MNFLTTDLSEEQRELRQRVMSAVIDAVLDASSNGDASSGAIVDMPVAIDGVATALAWIASNVPEFRSQRGARLLADDVRDLVKGLIRQIAESPDGGRGVQFAWPVEAVGGRA